MWDKQYDKASFAGIPFDVLTTEQGNGHRVSVQELPYSDQASVEVMGTKNNSWNLDAVFVGEHGLNNAQAFVAKLSSNPVGTLEHPDLGELDAVFVSSKLKLSTKRGLVTVSLEFISNGQPITVPVFQPWKLEIDAVEQTVLSHFLNKVKQATSIDSYMQEVNDALSFVTNLAGDLQKIADILSMPSHLLTQFHQQIDRLLNSANQILLAPEQFVNHLRALQSTLTNQFSSSGSGQANALTADQRLTKLRIDSINDSTSAFAKQSTVLELAKRLAVVLPDDGNQKDAANAADAIAAHYELNQAINLINTQITDITGSTDEDSVQLYQQFRQLGDALAAEKAKYAAQINQLATTTVKQPQPLLKLQYQYGSNLEQLNSITHPLFVSGELTYQKDYNG